MPNAFRVPLPCLVLARDVTLLIVDYRSSSTPFTFPLSDQQYCPKQDIHNVLTKHRDLNFRISSISAHLEALVEAVMVQAKDLLLCVHRNHQ